MYPQKPYETYSSNAPPVIGAPINPVGQPSMYPMQGVPPQAWSSGLCDCGQDCGNCNSCAYNSLFCFMNCSIASSEFNKNEYFI
jgi:hypothetical protein